MTIKERHEERMRLLEEKQQAADERRKRRHRIGEKFMGAGIVLGILGLMFVGVTGFAPWLLPSLVCIAIALTLWLDMRESDIEHHPSSSGTSHLLPKNPRYLRRKIRHGLGW